MQRCPKCDSAMAVKRSKAGREFLGCLRYPDCKGTRDLEVRTTPDEALAPQTVKLSPRTVAAIAITAQLAAAQAWDEPEHIVDDAMAITRCLMTALRDDDRRIMEARAARAANDARTRDEAGAEVAGEVANSSAGNQNGSYGGAGGPGMGSQA